MTDHSRLLTTAERLSVPRFIALVALIAGLLQGTPQTLAGSWGRPALRSTATIAVMIVAVAAGLVLWWIAVRRRQFSFWRTAWHVTIALTAGDFIGFAVGFAAASMQTNGGYAQAYMHAPWGATIPPLIVLPIIRVPGRFLLAALLVFAGRKAPAAEAQTS